MSAAGGAQPAWSETSISCSRCPARINYRNLSGLCRRCSQPQRVVDTAAAMPSDAVRRQEAEQGSETLLRRMNEEFKCLAERAGIPPEHARAFLMNGVGL